MEDTVLEFQGLNKEAIVRKLSPLPGCLSCQFKDATPDHWRSSSPCWGQWLYLITNILLCSTRKIQKREKLLENQAVQKRLNAYDRWKATPIPWFNIDLVFTKKTCSFIFNTPKDKHIYITWKHQLNCDICTGRALIMDQQGAEDKILFQKNFANNLEKLTGP